MKKNIIKNQKTISCETEIKVRFSEIDAMTIVWHGSYVKYFEDGREDFGEKYELGYMDIYSQGYMTPLVKLEMNYKKSLSYNDIAVVKTIFTDNPAAKIIFKYEIRKKTSNELIATAESIQVFVNKNRELELYPPNFFINWKKKYLQT